jgi:hypothetical protein
MFPAFRIISDGPETTPTSFISNESLYNYRGLGGQPSTMPAKVPAQDLPILLPDFGSQETPEPEEPAGEDD